MFSWARLLVSMPYISKRFTHYSDRWLHFLIIVHRFCNRLLWQEFLSSQSLTRCSLPAHCFSLGYNLNCFKSRKRKHLLSLHLVILASLMLQVKILKNVNEPAEMFEWLRRGKAIMQNFIGCVLGDIIIFIV